MDRAWLAAEAEHMQMVRQRIEKNMIKYEAVVAELGELEIDAPEMFFISTVPISEELALDKTK